ncbi:MAG TPA: c-type cytochrome domain-containing protein [Candidatus Saccharimonadales bacterium]|nr:c-type cytochrome domain-containing protein [Candidatus Saccharimonadales bacterium]
MHSARKYLLVMMILCWRTDAAEIPGALLPPPANTLVDFDHDIRPILEQSCLRCHGTERPKSHFRLDNRASALKGGSEGVDIIPHNSAHSPLIRYVAGTDDEIKMPPRGKGKLTEEQIGLLRAWIDQGAEWGKSNNIAGPLFNAELALGGISVHGNEGKFRELEWTRDGLSGGVKSFALEESISPDEKFSAEGHYLSADQDAQLKLAFTQDEVGFIHAGFEQWRKYTENGGGYDPIVAPSEFMVNSNLFLTEGRGWIDFGLAPPNWPVITLGYEYQYRNGAESTLDWGYVQGENIYPATTSIDEATHIVKLDVSGERAGWEFAESARVEIHRQNNHDIEPNVFGAGPGPDTLIQTQDNYHSVQGMSTLMVEKQVRDWWRASAGYYYSRLEGGDFFNQTTTSAANTPFFGNYWTSPQVTLSTESHIFSAAGLFTPVEYLTLSLASQNEWTREEGFGEADLSSGLPTVPALFFLFPVSNDSNLDKFKAMQSATLRYTQIPWTVLSADLRFSQEQIGEFQEQAGGVPEAFTRKTDADNELYDLRTGFNTSPWTWFSLNTQYRFSSSDTAYNHVLDSTPLSGYPAFILGRQIRTDDLETKLILRPASWLKTTLTYDIVKTDYSSDTDPVAGGVSPGGALLAGLYNSRDYGLNITLTPHRAFYFSGAFTYSDSKTTTFANSDPSVVPYKGAIYTLTTTAGCALSKTAELNAAYSFSTANYGENNAAAGVPLGLDYNRHNLTFGLSKKINPRLSATLRYIFSTYTEPNTGGFNNYTSQGVFATVAYGWR